MRLLTAVQKGTEKDVAQLLTRKLINVNSADANGRTAVAVAASEGRADIARFLVSQGAEVNR